MGALPPASTWPGFTQGAAFGLKWCKSSMTAPKTVRVQNAKLVCEGISDQKGSEQL